MFDVDGSFARVVASVVETSAGMLIVDPFVSKVTRACSQKNETSEPQSTSPSFKSIFFRFCVVSNGAITV